YYNVDLLKKAGVEPPKTWAELKETAKKLSGGQTYGLAFPGAPNEQGTFHTSTFVWSNGGSFDKLNSPQTIGALEYLADLVKIGAVSKSVITWGIDESRDQFLAGRAAMLIGGSWLMPQLDKHPDLHYGIVPIPTPKADEQVKVPVGGELWVVGDRRQGSGEKDDRVSFEPRSGARICRRPPQHTRRRFRDGSVQQGSAEDGALRFRNGGRRQPHLGARHGLSEIFRRLFGGDAGCSDRAEDGEGSSR